MTIENIELDEEFKEQHNINKMVFDFNKEAEKIGIPFVMKYSLGYPRLFEVKKLLFKYKTEISAIYYVEDINTKEKLFSFSNKLSYKIFEEVEPVIKEIGAKFKIKLSDGKIPIKYKIMDKL